MKGEKVNFNRNDVSKNNDLADRVIALIETARRKVATAANIAQVYTNFEIGRQIVVEEQGGKARAEYGKQILIYLSNRLTARFGRGWSVETLTLIRKFYLVYSNELQTSKNSQTVFTKSEDVEIVNGVYEIQPHPVEHKFVLSWSHYLLLMRIKDPVEREFYEREAAERLWGFRRLERMYRSSLFERIGFLGTGPRISNLPILTLGDRP